MAFATSTIIATAALATTAVGAYQQNRAAKKAEKGARRANRRAQAAQEQAVQAQKQVVGKREEIDQVQAAQADVGMQQVSRRTIREERIRRARIMQAAQNTGVGFSSGAFGSVAALGTQSASNLGQVSSNRLASRGIGRASSAITGLNQQIAGFQTQAGNFGVDAQNAIASGQRQSQLWGSVGSFGGSIFQATGGFGNLFGGTQGGSPIQGGFQSEVFTG